MWRMFDVWCMYPRKTLVKSLTAQTNTPCHIVQFSNVKSRKPIATTPQTSKFHALVWNRWSVWTAQFSWQHSGRFASSCGKKLRVRARAALNLKDIQIPDIPDEHIPTKEANFVGCYFCYVVFLRSVTVWNKPTWTQQGRPGDESCKKNGSWLPISCLMLTWICGVEGRWFFKNNQGCVSPNGFLPKLAAVQLR